MAGFKHGDLDLISENSVGLSGGQKARLSLARAVWLEVANTPGAFTTYLYQYKEMKSEIDYLADQVDVCHSHGPSVHGTWRKCTCYLGLFSSAGILSLKSEFWVTVLQ